MLPSWLRPLTHLRTRRVRKLRQIVLDLKRIRAMYTAPMLTPNPRELRVVRVPLRDRIMESWQVWRAEWRAAVTPRTPGQVAELAYRRALIL